MYPPLLMMHAEMSRRMIATRFRTIAAARDNAERTGYRGLRYPWESAFTGKYIKVKVKVWTLAIVPLTWVGLMTSNALQSRKWQLIGMSQWYHSALCGHPLPVIMDSWTHGAASRHTIAPISRTRPLPRSYYSFSVPLRVGGWVGLSTQ